MQIEFLKIAETELKDAVNYYNTKKNNLGFEFAKEVRLSLNNISNQPELYPKFSKNTRKYNLNRFPYGLIYTLLERKIIIVAVMHLHRKPGYWIDRI